MHLSISPGPLVDQLSIHCISSTPLVALTKSVSSDRVDILSVAFVCSIETPELVSEALVVARGGALSPS